MYIVFTIECTVHYIIKTWDGLISLIKTRYYDSDNPDQGPISIGKLPELKEKASESSSKIQAYVNYVLELTPYSSLAEKNVAKVNIWNYSFFVRM